MGKCQPQCQPNTALGYAFTLLGFAPFGQLKSVRQLLELSVVMDSDQPAGDDDEPQVLLLIQIVEFKSSVQNSALHVAAVAIAGTPANANKNNQRAARDHLEIRRGQGMFLPQWQDTQFVVATVDSA